MHFNQLSNRGRNPPASLPTALAAALVYWLVTRIIVIPARRGGYRD
jgi:hypothetical protein